MIELTKENFELEVLKSDKPAAVDFWAPWCGPCRTMGPVFEELAGENKEVKFVKLNIDNNQELAMQYEVMSIPTILFFKDSKNIGNLIGAVPKQELQDRINELF